LRAAALRLGVRIHEHTRADGLREAGDAVDVPVSHGRVRARRVLLAMTAYPPPLRAIGRYVVPVYDYALVTEPLSAAQREAIGRRRRQGLGDGANQFHDYRLTADDRILFGGYDAVYRYCGPVGPAQDDHEPAFGTLAKHFFTRSRSCGACA
jgi:glycine/D-amino acid oxidase-like deaminating enzyme